MLGGGVVYNDFANVDIRLGIMFSSGVLAALGDLGVGERHPEEPGL